MTAISDKIDWTKTAGELGEVEYTTDKDSLRD